MTRGGEELRRHLAMGLGGVEVLFGVFLIVLLAGVSGIAPLTLWTGFLFAAFASVFVLLPLSLAFGAIASSRHWIAWSCFLALLLFPVVIVIGYLHYA